MQKAIKVATVKPGGTIIYLDVPKSRDQKIAEMRRNLNLNERWERIKFQLKLTKP
jgi:hypothetical protein